MYLCLYETYPQTLHCGLLKKTITQKNVDTLFSILPSNHVERSENTGWCLVVHLQPKTLEGDC